MTGRPPDDLTRSILEATTGPTCASARERLCDWVDGRLEGVDEGLVALHAGSCPECAGLAAALRSMERDLPGLASRDPGPGFTEAVLAATEALRTIPLVARIGAAVQAMLQRPRFALEGAFIGSFILVLVFGTPGSPLAGVPQQALALASVNPLVELREPAAELEASLSEDVKTAWRTTSGRVTATSETVAGKIGKSFAVILDAFSRDRPAGDSMEPGGASGRQTDHEETERDESTDGSRENRGHPDGDSE